MRAPPARAAPRPRRPTPEPTPSPPRRAAFFLGGVPTLKHKEVIASPVDRFRLQTGEVLVSVGVITKDFMLYLVSS